jgi:hypothetical protein
MVTGDRSLIVSDSLLKHEKVMEILSEGLSGVDLRKNTLKDLAVVLSYEILFTGYFLGTFSKMLKDIYFYSFRPITMMKNYLIQRDVTTPLASSLLTTNRKRAYANRPHIINDIVKDYGIIESDRNSLWSFVNTKL